MPKKKAEEIDVFDAPEPEAPSVIKVRWTSGNRGVVGGRPRYRDDVFECSQEDFDKHRDNLLLL